MSHSGKEINIGFRKPISKHRCVHDTGAIASDGQRRIRELLCTTRSTSSPVGGENGEERQKVRVESKVRNKTNITNQIELSGCFSPEPA